MAPIVYVDCMSPCSQSVALLQRAVPGLEAVTLTNVKLADGDCMKPEFVKKFPMHAVPALEDDGFYLWESHAICPYLMAAYAKDDKLYPKNDHKKRAKVDQWLHFSNSILYVRLRDMSEPIWRQQTKTVPDAKKERVAAALTDMETMMGNNKWLCGDEMTLADICAVCEVNASTALFGDISQFKVVTAWVERCRAAMAGFDDIVTKGNEGYKAALKFMMSS
ncbi:glutathione S-transferase D7-like [Thrips palmi]|uniref:Glutathione S-transferase D7-like n=1 Tax=Thrips palmi TaxID=161013 RepID=A0A6P9A5J2_THRPL|nr:glutathione S-transferase D7-like [Thrips palmi]XP_034253229.1 glutathione S-transferase D7-like [Thrips palmi]